MIKDDNCTYNSWKAMLMSMLFILSGSYTMAQDNGRVVKMVNIVADAAQLRHYKAALALELKTAVKVEPGVLALNAVYDKNDTTHITIMEVYTSADAYKAHLQSPHYKKYMAATKDMVKHREVTDAVPIALSAKPTNDPQDIATP